MRSCARATAVMVGAATSVSRSATRADRPAEHILQVARRHDRVTITATQDDGVDDPQPGADASRVSDVANAVLDGSDA